MLRKFVSHPLIDRLPPEVPLTRVASQHRVDAGCLVTVVQPLQRVVIVTEPPIDRSVSQLVEVLPQLAFATPATTTMLVLV